MSVDTTHSAGINPAYASRLTCKGGQAPLSGTPPARRYALMSVDTTQSAGINPAYASRLGRVRPRGSANGHVRAFGLGSYCQGRTVVSSGVGSSNSQISA